MIKKEMIAMLLQADKAVDWEFHCKGAKPAVAFWREISDH